MELTHQGGVEAESLLRPDQRTATVMPHGNRQGWEGEGEAAPFIRQEPVKLTPAWEGSNLPNDTLNFKDIKMDSSAPEDRRSLIYWTMLLHGLGTLTAWNMFITAKDYFVQYKLVGSTYQATYLVNVGYASQAPNVAFSWFNIFFDIGGKLETRIMISVAIEVIIFVLTSILAMLDSFEWTDKFFWLTMVTVVILNSCNAVYQNSVFGVAAKLPARYTGAIILGNNICGTLVVGIGLLTQVIGDVRTAAIYFFLGGMFILLVCFDTFVALPLNRFYRYYDSLKSNTPANAGQPADPDKGFCFLCKKSGVQFFNVWLTYFVTLALFPAIQSDIRTMDIYEKEPDKWFLGKNFALLTCFLTFNVTACLGNITANMFKFPSRRWLILLTIARLAFIPLFLCCNYIPIGVDRQLSVYIKSDALYWFIGALMGWTSGHCSSLGMIYASSGLDPNVAPKAGMYAGAFLVTGIFCGIMASGLGPRIVSWKYWLIADLYTKKPAQGESY